MSIPAVYDILILGGGPAGITAAIYGARAGLTVLILEKMLVGGEIVATERLDNYPGFPEGIGGAAFGQLLESQARRFQVEIETGLVEEAALSEEPKVVKASGREYRGRKVIVATGTMPRPLNVPGEQELRGKGVSYCASCDAAFFRGKEIAVVGGGDAAVEEAVFLSRVASKVYVIHRRDTFRAVKALQEKLLERPNVQILWNTTVTAIVGEGRVEELRLQQEGRPRDLKVQGVFIYVGRTPNTGFLHGQVDTDRNGYIITDAGMRTSLPGVFAAGDVRNTELRQVITAAADGAVAATTAIRELYGI